MGIHALSSISAMTAFQSEIRESSMAGEMTAAEVQERAMRNFSISDEQVRRMREIQKRAMERVFSPPMMFGNFMDRAVMDALGLEESKSKFPEYSEEKFENISNEPIVKEIMPGMVKLTKEQSAERIRLHLEK